MAPGDSHAGRWPGARVRRGCRALAVAALLLAVTPRFAQAGWYLAPFAGIKFGGDTTFLDFEQAADDKKFVLGGTGAWLSDGVLGIEADFALIPGYLKGNPPEGSTAVQTSRVTTLMGNAVLAAPLAWTGYSLRPYVSGGFGLVHLTEEGVPIGRIDRTLWGFNLGGGAMGFVTRRTGLRWDYRYVRGWGPGDGDCLGSCRVHLWRASMGVVFRY